MTVKKLAILSGIIAVPVIPTTYYFLKTSRGGGNSTVEVSLDFENFRSGITSGDLSKKGGVKKSSGCKSLAQDTTSYNSFSELFVCSDPYSPSTPNVYFYKLEKLNEKNENIPKTLNAEKVIGLSFKIETNNQNLEVTLEGGKKEFMQPAYLRNWAEVNNLNPHKECKLVSSSEKVTMQCTKQREGHATSIIFDLS